VEKAAAGFDGVGRPAADLLERLVDGVCVGEDVMGGFPIGGLVGDAEARYPESRGISERSTEIGRPCPVPRCNCERGNDRSRIVAETAEAESTRRVDVLAENGDDAGAAVWRRIIDAIGQLTKTTLTGPVH